MPSNDEVLFVFELSAEFESDTQFTEPYAVVFGPDPAQPTTINKFYLPLPDAPDVGEWSPGEYVEILLPLNGLAIDWTDPSQIEAGLIVSVTEPSSPYPVADYSALRVEVQ